MSDVAEYPIVVLASGRGSNLSAIIATLHDDPASPVRIVKVVVSSSAAPAAAAADAAGIPVSVVDRADFGSREERDRALAAVVADSSPQLVVLAGWMSILTPDFLDDFPDQVINLHPSMLPSFPGMHAIEEALKWGVRFTGVTVHYADPKVDGGPPILQEPVPVYPDDSVESLRERIRQVEHAILPHAVALFAAGRVSRDPNERRRVVITDGSSE